MDERPTDRDQQDDDLLEQLRAIVSRVDPVPGEALLAARSKLAYLRLDAELAELTFDSASDELDVVAMRHEAPVRRLAFEAGTAQVEVEVESVGDRRRLIGQCIPTTEVAVTVRCEAAESLGAPEATTLEVATDDLGRFTVEVPAGAVSLRCSWVHVDLTVETTWVRV